MMHMRMFWIGMLKVGFQIFRHAIMTLYYEILDINKKYIIYLMINSIIIMVIINK